MLLAGVMQRVVIRQNIEHHRALLDVTTDPSQHRAIEKLFREEEAKLKSTTKITRGLTQTLQFFVQSRSRLSRVGSPKCLVSANFGMRGEPTSTAPQPTSAITARLNW